MEEQELKENNPRIDLKRLCKPYNFEESQYDTLFYGATSLLDIFSDDNEWDILVLLGDKGSGKTTEIKHMAEFEKKGISFFSELDNYYKNSQKIDKNVKFAFFDSIDEFELLFENDKNEKFIDILKQIKNNTPKKCKIVFTCREVDFSKEKLDLIETTFEREELVEIEGAIDLTDPKKTLASIEKKVFEPIVKMYTFLPLNDNGVKTLCEHLMPSQCEQFFIAKENSSIHNMFFDTPVECIDTMKFFKRYDKLPRESFKELMDFFHHKLYFRYRELNHKHPQMLPLQKIKMLSQRVAIINSLTNRASIRKQENYKTQKKQLHESSNDISISDAFPEEAPKTLEDYISSTLFSSNGTNRVKFYNETIRHYLAYLWLKERFSRQSYSKVKFIIFNLPNECSSPRFSLFIPVIMLSAEEYRIKKVLIDQHPDLLMRFAHYANLNIDDKKRIFNNLINKFQYRLSNFNPYSNPDDRFGLQVFSDVVLLDEYINNYDKCEFDGKYILLHLIDALKKEHLQNPKTTNFLWEVLNDNHRNLSNLSLQILLKNEHNFKKIAETFNKKVKPINEYSLNMLIEKLYPNYLSLSDIAKFINSFKTDKGAIRVRTITDIINNFAKNKLTDKQSLINFLEDIKQSDKTQKHIVIIYINLLIQFLEKYPNENTDVIDHLINLQEILLSERYRYSNEMKKIITELKKHINESLNLTLLDKISNLYLDKDEAEELKKMLYMRNYDEVQIFEVDLNKIIICNFFLLLSKDDRLNEEEQKELLQYIWLYLPSEINMENKIKLITPYCDTLLKKELLQNLINPVPYEELPEIIKRNKKLKKRNEDRERQKEKNKEDISKKIDLIKNGDEKIFNELFYLSSRTMGYNLEEADVTEIEKEFGIDIKEAYLSGLKKYWQNCEFDLNDYLNIEENAILNQSIVALPGISLSFSDENFELTSDLAKRAIYFGIQELNNLPNWFDNVIEKYPSEALEILVPVMEHVLNTEKNRFGIFSKIQRLNLNSLAIISKPLWGLIDKSYIKFDDDVLQVALECLIDINNLDKNKIINIIQSKINDENNAKAISWFILLFDYDVDLFIRELEQFTQKKDDEFFINVFANIYGHGSSIASNKLNKIISLDQLIKLISIVFRYAPPETDIHHPSGTVFSPSNRDDAESLRHSLLSLVNQYESSREDALKVKKLANDISSSVYKPDLLIKADMMIYNDKSVKSFTEKDIISLEEGDFLPPDNAKELFDIVYATLEDIKENIEKGDHSIRNLYIELEHKKAFSKLIKEKYFQQYILMNMRSESKNLYSSVREAEVDDDKKPDLQIWERNFCTTIECKIANQWSYQELEEAITEQLVGKYLKHSMYEYGILLLFNTNKDRGWNPSKKDKLDFDNLIDKLQKVADEQYKKFNHIKQIKVIGIKFYGKDIVKKTKTTKKKA